MPKWHNIASPEMKQRHERLLFHRCCVGQGPHHSVIRSIDLLQVQNLGLPWNELWNRLLACEWQKYLCTSEVPTCHET